MLKCLPLLLLIMVAGCIQPAGETIKDRFIPAIDLPAIEDHQLINVIYMESPDPTLLTYSISGTYRGEPTFTFTKQYVTDAGKSDIVLIVENWTKTDIQGTEVYPVYPVPVPGINLGAYTAMWMDENVIYTISTTFQNRTMAAIPIVLSSNKKLNPSDYEFLNDYAYLPVPPANWRLYWISPLSVDENYVTTESAYQNSETKDEIKVVVVSGANAAEFVERKINSLSQAEGLTVGGKTIYLGISASNEYQRIYFSSEKQIGILISMNRDPEFMERNEGAMDSLLDGAIDSVEK